MSNDTNRVFPQSVEVGDHLVGRYPIPVIPGYTSGEFDDAVDAVDIYKAFFSDVGNTDRELEFTAAIEIENPGTATERELFVFDIDTSAEGWQARPYHFRIEGAWTRNASRRTFSFARGIIQVIDTATEGVDALVHSQSMILVLRQVIKSKLDDSGDILSYSIGTRDITLEPVGALRRELRRYENDLVRLRGGEKFGPKVSSANTAPEG